MPDSIGAPWRLVFSTCLHGESFTRMVAGLSKHGPTLLLIKDTKGHVFGGFASHGWEVKPQFQGEILSLFKNCMFFFLLLRGEQGVLFIGFLAVGFTMHNTAMSAFISWSLILLHFFTHRRMFIQLASYLRLHGLNRKSSLLLKSRLNICCVTWLWLSLRSL